jgi:RNA polymerase sigma factor (sigma-70 family)
VSTAVEKWAASRQRDRKLVAACRKGDEAAWVELWTSYGPLVKSVARRVGCDREESRDVLQRVALVAVQRLDTLREPGKLPGWLAGVSRFQALEVIRSRRPTEELHPWSAVQDAGAEEAYQREQELVILRRAMLELDERCRRMIRLLDLDEPPASYQQVAESEGLAPTSIGPIRRRCLRRLKKIIDSLSRGHTSSHFQVED